MPLKPLNKHVVAKLYEKPLPKGALILKAEPPKIFYDVICAAPEVDQVAPGDRIMIHEGYGRDFEVDGEIVTIIHIDKVLAIV